MKKIISTLLILAMVLTMALTVSAAPGATLSSLMEGDYVIYDPMAQAMGAGDIVIYELSFQKTSLAGGTLTIVDNNFSGIGGTYTYTVDSTDVATITVETGNTGDASAAAAMNFSYDLGGNLIFALGVMQQYTCIPTSGSTPGGGTQTPTGTALTLGANDIPVTISNNFAPAINVYFTATEAGTYTLSFADDETTGSVGIETNTGSEDLPLPYTFTLAAGESFEAFVSTTLNVMQNEGVTDHINLVLTKQGAQGGGNAGGGSANTGDSVALYVALGAVALASIFGCAIVSKKRVTE